MGVTKRRDGEIGNKEMENGGLLNGVNEGAK